MAPLRSNAMGIYRYAWHGTEICIDCNASLSEEEEEEEEEEDVVVVVVVLVVVVVSFFIDSLEVDAHVWYVFDRVILLLSNHSVQG